MRLTARGWRFFAVLMAGICATPALAAPPRKGQGTVSPARGSTGPRPAEADARRRDEVDALQRQDIAEALKRHHNINVDWRTTPLDRLIDIRVRAAKAAELQERLGVTVDWQLYSWIELEALRRTLLSFERYRGDSEPATAAATPRPPELPAASAANGLVKPTFKGRPTAAGGRSTDPDGIIKPTFAGRAEAPTNASRDPDGVIRPTFAARPRWSSSGVDTDGLIAPTFVPARHFSPIGDADDLIDPTPTPTPTPTPVRALRPAPSRW